MTPIEMVDEIDRLAWDYPNRADIHNLAAALHNRAADAESEVGWLKNGPLIQSDETITDYRLKEGKSVWVTVGPLGVWIRDCSESMELEVYVHFAETNDPLDTISVTYADLPDEAEEEPE